MDLKSLKYVKVELADNIAELVVSRPKALNAINREVLEELETALGELKTFDSLSCLVLTGDGDKAFIAGADIAEMSDMSAQQAEAMSIMGHGVCDMLASFPVPTLAAVNGYALGGGCEIAAACDIIYASDNAKFGQPEVKLGLIPGFGGCVRLARKVGLQVASEWVYTGEIYSAHAAKEVGLANEVIPAGDLLKRVRTVAKLIASRAPLAIRAAKRVMTQGLAIDPHSASRLEQWSFAKLFESEDMREGTRAFVDKRDPNFQGK